LPQNKPIVMNMNATMKVLGLMALTTVCTPRLNAQFEEGDNVIGLGIGIGGGYGVGLSGGGVTQSPAFALHYDHGMGDLGPGQWGLGGYVAYKTISYDERYFNFYNYDYRYTFFVLGARGSWHYNEWHGVDALDTYGTLMLAYRSVTFKDNTDYGPYNYLNTYSYSGSGIDLGIGLGARYWFSDQIGAFAELGYGITWLQLGVSMKF
jgi:hypothetical protein